MTSPAIPMRLFELYEGNGPTLRLAGNGVVFNGAHTAIYWFEKTGLATVNAQLAAYDRDTTPEIRKAGVYQIVWLDDEAPITEREPGHDPAE